MRLDKYRADPARDAAKLKELQPLEQRYWRLVAERKGQVDARMQELPLDAGRAARELLRARAAHAVPGEHQAAGQAVGAGEQLTVGLCCMRCALPIKAHEGLSRSRRRR